jgi:hypothetical protein
MKWKSGNNFGPSSPRVLIGSNECTSLNWINHSQVTCLLPSGLGNDRYNPYTYNHIVDETMLTMLTHSRS